MSAPDSPGTEFPGPDIVRHRVQEATQRLLGDTISLSDDDWQAPSALPGWTRAHIASHLARNAEGLAGLLEQVRAGEPAALYDSADARDLAIERGSERSGLDLQIDLDTSAGQLAQAWSNVPAELWQEEVTMGTRRVALGLAPLARLQEVLVHHVDLACGFSFEDIRADTAVWLLRWTGLQRRMPPTTLTTDDGQTIVLGETADDSEQPVDDNDEPRRLVGHPARLLGWLTGRVDANAVQGAGPSGRPL